MNSIEGVCRGSRQTSWLVKKEMKRNAQESSPRERRRERADKGQERTKKDKEITKRMKRERRECLCSSNCRRGTGLSGSLLPDPEHLGPEGKVWHTTKQLVEVVKPVRTPYKSSLASYRIDLQVGLGDYWKEMKLTSRP